MWGCCVSENAQGTICGKNHLEAPCLLFPKCTSIKDTPGLPETKRTRVVDKYGVTMQPPVTQPSRPFRAERWDPKMNCAHSSVCLLAQGTEPTANIYQGLICVERCQAPGNVQLIQSLRGETPTLQRKRPRVIEVPYACQSYRAVCGLHSRQNTFRASGPGDSCFPSVSLPQC